VAGSHIPFADRVQNSHLNASSLLPTTVIFPIFQLHGVDNRVERQCSSSSTRKTRDDNEFA